MAVAFVKAHTVTSEKVLDPGVNFTVDTGGVAAGNLLVLAVVYDNAATVGKPVVNSSIGKQAGETATWVSLGASRHPSSTSIGAFAGGELWAIRTTVPWGAATTYGVVLDVSVTMKATVLVEFSGAEATLRSTVGTAYSTTTTAASAATTGTTPVIGDLALGFLFGSNIAVAPAGDTDTTGGSWSTAIGVGSTGGSTATNNFGIVQHKILTAASHQTYNSSAAGAAGNGSIVAILQAVVPPAITQAAYRLYADGTETGSTALANQDTAATADLAAGDVNLQLRTRLQETNGGVVPALDDWQLQWEKNASGTWTDVAGAVLVSGSNPSGGTSNVSLTTASTPALAQSFVGDGRKLVRASASLTRSPSGLGTPNGTITMSLWAHTGTFGSTGVPATAATAPLATSTTTINSTDLTAGTTATTYFDFDGTVTLAAGTNYFIGVTTTNSTSVLSWRASPPAVPGNRAGWSAGAWTASTVSDQVFEVYTQPLVAPTTVVVYDSPSLTDGAATTSRLTGGTGSFVAGKVSEDGLVDDLGWTASNHTEVLYSLTLKQADLANTDTLRFRVLRNGATTSMTYTQVPTITVSKGVAGGKGSVVVGGVEKAVVNRWVIVGGVKKPVVGASVIVGGAKKTVV